jgi:sporulation protein YlmC with PRC-barrel domain
MNKLIIASAASILVMGSSAAALAVTSTADCQALFEKADINRDGTLQSNEGNLFLNAMTQAQVQPQDASKVTANEFMAACQKDAFVNIDPGLGTAQSSGTAAPEVQADQAVAAPTGFMISSLIGADISSPAGENIGEVKDVVLSPQGNATHLIVDIGDKDVEVERSRLDVAATENGLKVMLNGTQAELAQLPAVSAASAEQQTAGQTETTSQQPAVTGETTTTAEQSAGTEQPAAQGETEVSQTIAAPQGFMASNLIGATVRNANDENLGEVKNIVFSQQGEPTHVIIDIGDKDVEVEKGKLDISASEDGMKVVLNGTQADLAKLPAVNVDAAKQQAASTSSQPQEPSAEAPATGEQAAAPAQPTQQSTTTEQAPASEPSSTEAQAPSAEQPSTSSEATSAEQATAPEQPASSAAPAETNTAAVEQPATTGETTQAEPAEQALAIPDGLMVSDVVGATVYSPSDEKLGEINDLALSSGAGQKPRVVIGVGGFFGIGEKDVSVEMSRLKFTTTEDGLKIVLDATKQDLENLAATSPQ